MSKTINPNHGKLDIQKDYVNLGQCQPFPHDAEDGHVVRQFDNSLYKNRGTDIILICDACKAIAHVDSSG